VNNLLDLSRITADRLELRERPIELPVVLAQITNGFATAAESRNLTLTLEVKENLPRLRADLRLLRSMMQALISNAVKFTGKRQKITVRALLDDGNRIVIAVADTGEGIAPKDLTDIMQPFGQAFSSDKPRRSGIGLGLPLTKSMVELHGGTFELRSVEHEGTTVTLRFPAERTVAEAKPAEEPAAAEAAPPPAAAEAETPPPARPQETQELRRNII
jgi:signal transduction histidine kinase